jgi:hypothetical protein
MRVIGDALHLFLASDRPAEMSLEMRLELGHGILASWKVGDQLRAEDLVAASDRLHEWIAAASPAALVHREWPVAGRDLNGTLTVGSADLVLESPESLVLIDHKTFPGSLEDAAAKAASFGGQLRAYAGLLEAATGKPVSAQYVHLPVLAVVLPLAIA